MTLKSASIVALLALLAAACQPADNKPPTPAAEAAKPVETAAATPEPAPVTSSPLAKFATGQFGKLEFDGGTTIPAASFVDAAGKPHSFAEYKGKVVVYNVWAEWCGPCVEEMPSLVGLKKAFAGKDVVVVPVAYGGGAKLESTAAKLKTLAGTELPFFFDAEMAVNSQAKTGALPSTIIYDKSGKEAARLMYPAAWDKPDAIALVQAVLDGPK